MASHTHLTGRVVQPPTGPVAGVTVELVVDSETVASDETDDDGGFTLHVDEAPTMESTLVVDDRIEESVTVADDGGTVDPVVLPPDGDAGPSHHGHRPSRGAMKLMTASYADDVSGGIHGSVEQRGLTETPRRPAASGLGRFERLFDFLPAATHDVAFLEALGGPNGPMNLGDEERPERRDFPPAGYVFYGQFIDHDVTLDTTSSLDRQVDPAALRNFRTPGLDLDNVYGAGREVDRHLYQNGDPGAAQSDEHKLLVGPDTDGTLADLPRNAQGVALIGDPRNDENQILSQLHVSMLGAHNRIVDRLADERVGESAASLEEASQLLRWHHQYLVVNDFLPRVCQETVLDDVLENGRELFTVPDGEQRYVPVEFAGAAYRYGHSRIEETYRLNEGLEADLFQGEPHLRGGRRLQGDRRIDWSYFFDLEGTQFEGAADDEDLQRVAPIDRRLPESLLRLPMFADEGAVASLATRNLLRGRRLGLPSGQAAARAVDAEVFTADDLGYDDDVAAVRRESGVEPGDPETPLWYYVLAEAEVANGGARLGPVGSRIVAETLLGLVDESRASYRTVQPNWTPAHVDELPFDEEMGVGELLAFGADARC